MSEGTIGKGSRTEVFFSRGTFVGEQEPRYAHAPFDIVNVATESGAWAQGIMTNGRPYGGADAVALLNGSSADIEDQSYGTDFGYVRLGPLCIGDHQMGDMSDTLLGMHRIGYL